MGRGTQKKDIKYKLMQTLIASGSPQAFTAAWVTLGSVIVVDRSVAYDRLSLFFDFDVNNGVDCQVRFGLRFETGGDNYFAPTYKSVSDQVKIVPQIYEIDSDVDTKYVERISLAGAVEVDIQIYAAAPGTPAAAIAEAIVILETE
jgi:hypothetical protein